MGTKRLDSLTDSEYKKFERKLLLIAIAIIGVGCAGAFAWKKISNPPAQQAITQDEAKLLKGAKLLSGRPDDQVVVVEFFDYQCPACRMLRASFESQLKSTPVNHALYAQNLPLAQHKYARDLAVIADSLNGAELQQFHQVAFATPEPGLPSLITSWGNKLTARDSEFVDKGLDQVKLTEAAAQDINVTGTPTVFVVDRRHHKVWLCKSAGTVGDTLALCQ